MLSRYKRVYKPDEWRGEGETVPVKETASDDIAKQPKGIHESAVTPQGLHYEEMHNATCARGACGGIIHSNVGYGYDFEKDFPSEPVFNPFLYSAPAWLAFDEDGS